MFVYSIVKRFYKRPLTYTNELKNALVSSNNSEIKTFRLCDEAGEAVKGAELPAELCNTKTLKRNLRWDDSAGQYGQVTLRSAKTRPNFLLHDEHRGRSDPFRLSAGFTQNDPIYAQYRETGVLLQSRISFAADAPSIDRNCKDLGKGRQMPVHYGHGELKIQTISSPLGTQLPQAVGYAYFLKQLGKRPICRFVTLEGQPVKEISMRRLIWLQPTEDAFNLLLQEQPVCHLHARSWTIRRGRDCCTWARLRRSIHPGRWQWFMAVYAATKAAREMALKQGTPVLIEAMTHRIGHHSTSDDSTAYRPALDPVETEKSCPIARVRRHLQARGALKWLRKFRFNPGIPSSCPQKPLKPLKNFPNRQSKIYSRTFTISWHRAGSPTKQLMEHLAKYPNEYNVQEFQSK